MRGRNGAELRRKERNAQRTARSQCEVFSNTSHLSQFDNSNLYTRQILYYIFITTCITLRIENEELKKENNDIVGKLFATTTDTAIKENTQNNEYVTLENGAVMLKSQYENLVNTRQQEISKAKEAVNSVTNSDFKITIDDKGTQKEMNFAYEYSEEDKQSMVSIVSDIDGVVASRYGSEKGFDHKRFAEDMQWSDPKFREKAIASLLHKAIASNTEEVLKERGNVNFTNDSLQKQAKEGVKFVSVTDALKGNY